MGSLPWLWQALNPFPDHWRLSSHIFSDFKCYRNWCFFGQFNHAFIRCFICPVSFTSCYWNKVWEPILVPGNQLNVPHQRRIMICLCHVVPHGRRKQTVEPPDAQEDFCHLSHKSSQKKSMSYYQQEKGVIKKIIRLCSD